MIMDQSNVDFYIANVDDETPFETFVDTNPIMILTGNNARFTMENTYKFYKSRYQRYFDGYLTAEEVDNQTEYMASIFPPLYINRVFDDGTEIVFESIPFESQLWLYGEDDNPYLVFADNSLIRLGILEKDLIEQLLY